MFPSLREASFIETLRQLSGHARDPPIGRPSAEHAPCSGSYRKKARTDSGSHHQQARSTGPEPIRHRSVNGAVPAGPALAKAPRPSQDVAGANRERRTAPSPVADALFISVLEAAVWQDHVHRESDDGGKQDCHHDTQDPSTALVALGIVGLAVIRLVYSHGGRTLEASRRSA